MIGIAELCRGLAAEVARGSLEPEVENFKPTDRVSWIPCQRHLAACLFAAPPGCLPTNQLSLWHHTCGSHLPRQHHCTFVTLQLLCQPRQPLALA